MWRYVLLVLTTCIICGCHNGRSRWVVELSVQVVDQVNPQIRATGGMILKRPLP